MTNVAYGAVVSRRSLLAWVLSLVLTAAAPARAGTPEVEETFHQITRAVLAGDPQAYLAWVDASDPVFATEQRNWAADLERHRPAAFEMSLDLGTLEVRGDEALAKVTMVWRLAGEEGPGPERRVSHLARLVRGPTPLGHGWLYAGEAWRVAEAPGVRVLFAEGLDEIAAAVVRELPGVREHVNRGFGLESDEAFTSRQQQVKLYGSMEDLQASIYLSYVDSLGGWNEPGEAIKLLVHPGSRTAGLRVLLAHEYGHVATFELGPEANEMPWWVLEGAAELAAERYAGGRGRVDRLVEQWASSGGLVEWEKLADFRGEAANHHMHVYKQGQHMLGYISERFGREGRNRWLRAMAQGSTLDEATRGTLGMSFEELDAQWRQAAGEPTREPAE